MATLYDPYGRKVDTGVLKEERAAATIAGIRNIYSTVHIAASITPERLTEVLRQAEFGDPYYYLEFAQDIEERDLHYLAVLSTRKESVACLEPAIRAASKSALDQKIAEYVEETLFDRTLDLSLLDILDAIGKGFSVCEIIWDQDGPTEWFPRKLKYRDPRWFMFDWISGEEVLVRTLRTEGQMVPIVQQHGRVTPEPGSLGQIGIQPATAPLDPFKFVTHISKAKAGLPIRGGLARAAAWAYLFKSYILKDWVTFCEVYGQPLRVGKYNPGATEEDKQTLLTAISSIGTDSAAIIPESMVIEFVESKSVTQNGELYHRAVEYIDDALSKAVLGQTLTTQMPRQGGGSRAAAQVHDAVRRDILAFDARRLSATITRDLIIPMVQLTFGEQKAYPRFWLSIPADQDLKTQSDVITEMVDRGLEVGQDYVRDMLGIPVPAAGEAVLKPLGRSGGQSVGQNASRAKIGPTRPYPIGRALLMGEPLAVPEAPQAGKIVKKKPGRLTWRQY